MALKFLKLTAFVNEILWWMPGTPSHGVDAPAAGHSFAYACAYCTRVLLKRLLTHCQTPRRGFSSHVQTKTVYWTKKATLRARLRVALKFLKLTAFVNEILWWMPGTPSHGVDAPAAGHSFAYACAYCTRVLLKRLLTHCQTPRRGFSSHIPMHKIKSPVGRLYFVVDVEGLKPPTLSV